jgi:acetolactate synthase I/II/III large subunit
LDFNREFTVIQQAEVIRILSTLLPEDMRITTGVGNHQMLAAQYLKIRKPKSFLTSGGFGTMGFSLPCATGVHFADPSREVLAIDGDGSLRMNMGELHTIGSRGLPIKVLMLNNHSKGMVRNIQSARYEGRIIATEEACQTIDFAKIAHECGFTSTNRVEKRSDIKSALEELLASEGPAFLEVITDIEEAVYPVIAPGLGYQDMNLGPYIQNPQKR